MTDTPIRLAGLRGTLASFAVDLFAGRVGCATDAPMCTGGRDRWGIYDGSAWHLGPASDYAGNSNVLSLAVNGTETIDSARNVKAATLWSGGAIRADVNGDFSGRNQSLTGWLTLNGATRPAWGSSWAVTMLGGTSTIVTADATGNEATLISNNLYFDGTNIRAIVSSGIRQYPCYVMLNTLGGFSLVSSQTLPIAGGVISDLATRWAIDRFGNTSQNKQATQWASEPVTSGRYVKTSDTTIGPSAAAKASLLNGGVAAGGFAAVTDPAGRWNLAGAQNDTTLKGKISTVANQVLVFELYRNGAVAATLTIPARTYGTVTPWRLVIDQDVRVAGSNGTIRVDMRFHATADNVNAQASCYQMDTTLTGVNLTAAQTWDVVCTIPNNAANSITCTKAKKVG